MDNYDSNSGPKSMLKRQLLVVICSIGISFVTTFVFGIIIGFTLNILLLAVSAFYIRTKQNKALRKFGFDNERPSDHNPEFGRGKSNIKLKYLCLICGSKVTERTCKKCGSNMKKPMFT
jgi:hypothetical protein